MKLKSLEARLELYYDRLTNPQKLIGNWAIIDLDLLNSLKKITLTSISNVENLLGEKIITTESKKKYIVIKYSFNFIGIKQIDTEYDFNLKDWELIAVDREHIYKGKINKIMTTKEIIKLLGFKLNKKASKDLDYFDSF